LIFISTTASILGSFEVKENKCLELIAANIQNNDGVIIYPSTLGQDCNTRTKLQLVLFLVCIIYTKCIFVDLKKARKLLFYLLFYFIGNNVYERSNIVTLHPIVCRSLSSRLGSNIRHFCGIVFIILYFEHWNKLPKRFLFI